jgi:hypothetical protein
MYLNMCWPNPSHASEDVKSISTCVDETPPIPARTPNASQLVLIKTLPCQWGLKMYLNICWPNPSHASEDRKCNSTCVEQTPTMAARTQSVSQHVLTKSLPQNGHKMHLNLCWPNTTHASENTKWISTCVD